MFVRKLTFMHSIAFLLFVNYSLGKDQDDSVSNQGKEKVDSPSNHRSSGSMKLDNNHHFIPNKQIDGELDKVLAKARIQRKKIDKQLEAVKSKQSFEEKHVPYGTEDREKHLGRLHAQNKELETAKSLIKASSVFQKQHPALSQALYREGDKHHNQHEEGKQIFDAGMKASRTKKHLVLDHYGHDIGIKHQLTLRKHKIMTPAWKVLEGHSEYFDRKYNLKGDNGNGAPLMSNRERISDPSAIMHESRRMQKKWSEALSDHKDLHTFFPPA